MTFNHRLWNTAGLKCHATDAAPRKILQIAQARPLLILKAQFAGKETAPCPSVPRLHKLTLYPSKRKGISLQAGQKQRFGELLAAAERS